MSFSLSVLFWFCSFGRVVQIYYQSNPCFRPVSCNPRTKASEAPFEMATGSSLVESMGTGSFLNNEMYFISKSFKKIANIDFELIKKL